MSDAWMKRAYHEKHGQAHAWHTVNIHINTVDNTHITRNEEARWVFKSISNQSSKLCEVAQYLRQKRVTRSTHTHSLGYSLQWSSWPSSNEPATRGAKSKAVHPAAYTTGWRRLIGSPKLQVILHKRATKHRSLLRKMTYKDKGSYESSPPCTRHTKIRKDITYIYTHAFIDTHVFTDMDSTHIHWYTCTHMHQTHKYLHVHARENWSRDPPWQEWVFPRAFATCIYRHACMWHACMWYGVATISRLLQITGLFCRISSLL